MKSGTINVKVDYYDAEEKENFEHYPNAQAIQDIVGKHIRIDLGEFWAYMMFKDQQNYPGFRTYEELEQQIPRRYSHFVDFFNFHNGSISVHERPKATNEVRERYGEAVSLCLISQLHSLHEADWETIPESNQEKTLDYAIPIASNNEIYIQVESKGSFVDDNRRKNSSISSHKSSIHGKKSEQRENNPNNIYYGVISVLDERVDSVAQSWLVDPPAQDIGTSPTRDKLLKRLYFYWRNLKVINPRTPILQVLKNRIEVIRVADDYEQFDGLALQDINGEPIKIQEGRFTNYSSINEEEIIGQIIPVDETTVFFYGFATELYQILSDQKFDPIRFYEFEPSASTYNEVLCVIRKTKANELKIPKSIQQDGETKSDFFRFSLLGEILTTRAGRAFGFLNYPTSD